jgi:hypothetical protein
MKRFLLALFFLVFAGLVYADNFDYRNSGFLEGYSAGFHHGVEDVRGRLNFDFTHAPEYQNGVGYSSRSDCEFRVGYAEGYADGYFHRSPKYGNNYQNHGGYGNGGYSNGGYGNGGYGNGGYGNGYGAAVTVFSEPGFRGSARQFPVGRYDYLYGGWDDRIESLQTNGNVRIILFDERNFRGDRRVIEGTVVDLRDFRRKAASMIVEPIGRY